MESAHDRLRKARLVSGYASASDAARALGTSAPGYIHHENGSRGFTRAAERYARFFRVSLEWLLTGKGQMRGSAGDQSIPVMGIVTAGEAAIPAEAEAGALGEITPPAPGEVHAFRVEGDSMWPRFQHGELVMVDSSPSSLARTLNRYALVQLEDGRRLLKMVRPGTRAGLVTLESYNAPPLRDVAPLGFWAWRGTLPAN